MRRKWLPVIFILLCVFFSAKYLTQKSVQNDVGVPLVISKSPATTYVRTHIPSNNLNKVRSIFIPYWTIPTTSSEINKYDELIYFGVSPGENGQMIDDAGLRGVKSFIDNSSPKSKRLLTVRMLDTEKNLAILESKNTQKTLFRETLKIVEENAFDGVVLDLEVGVIPLEGVTSSITSFVSDFTQVAHNNDVTFAMTVYGDTFYRARPYDIKELSQHVDGMYIMAYDFHKSRGEPGPNFPFSNKKEYGYDFQTMIDDFTQIVSREKITVLFGMYGYDWTLGPQGKPLKAAKAVPLNKIDNTGAVVDPASKEKHVQYVDDEGYDHILWYEDKESVKVKIEYLKKLEIGNVGYWVWGYF